MLDAAKVNIINNTVSNNDSTATAGAAFTFGVPDHSNPQPAGIVSRYHSDALRNAMGAGTGQQFSAYSNPVLGNDIVTDNRSFHWQVNATTGGGSLVYDGINDLAVLGTTGSLNPLFSVLTNNNTGYDGSNILVASSASIFVNPYFNTSPGAATLQDGTLLPPEVLSLLAAAPALDEGGNFIDVLFGPLSLNTVPAIDYHTLPVSPAVDSGTGVFLAQYADLQTDIDGQLRPDSGTTVGTASTASTGGNKIDIGADETPPPDTDGDTIPDYRDNCTLAANANQRDTNGDGYGNLCDADFNGSGTVNTLDLNILKAAYGTAVGNPLYNPDVDLNGDNKVNTLDLSRFKQLYGKPIGPSCCGI